MAKKAKKRAARAKTTQRKSGTTAKPRAAKKRSASPTTTSPVVTSGGGGVMQSMRAGFKRAAGVGEPQQKESTLSKVLWGIAILAAFAYVAYKYTQ